MASGTFELREKQRWGENSRVYTRKFHNKRLKNSANDAVSVLPSSQALGAVENGNSLIQKNLSKLNGVSDDLDSPNRSAEVEVENGNDVIEHGPAEMVQMENGNDVIEHRLAEVEDGNDVVEHRPAEVEDGNDVVEHRPAEVENGNDVMEHQQAEMVQVENGNDVIEHRLAEVEDGNSVIEHRPVEVENGNDVIEHRPAEMVEVENGNDVIEHRLAQVQDGNDVIEYRPAEVVEMANGNEMIEHLPAEVKEAENGNGVIKPIVTRVDDKVRINLEEATNSTNSKDEIRELREKLVSELDQVRSLVKELEEKEVELRSVYSNTAAPPVAACSQSQQLGSDVIERRALTGVHSAVDSVVHPKSLPFHPVSVTPTRIDDSGDNLLESRPFHPVSIQVTGNNAFGDRRMLLRVNSEAGCMVGGQDRRSLLRVNSEVGGQDYRPFQQLSVSVVENNNHISGGGEFVEKEKRTPKANQFYRNSEFLLGKDRLPPESHRKAKSNGARKHGGFGFGIDRHRNQIFKNCSNLLQRLMKHKHGWVFNEPVNAKLLGLHDYHDIIKHPMDLSTIKSNLAQNLYKSPGDFAEDVRLTFRNAMTYNPKGQDVHVMAEQLLDLFEEKWAGIEAEYNSGWRYEELRYAGTPTSRKGPPHLPLLSMRALDRSQSMTAPFYSRLKSSIGPVSRTPVPKKPKAKDLNKRDMTYDEKQKLSTNLQGMPTEKLDTIVQIIKKRNSTVSEHNDEVEVDIDNVDVETLWELDRFYTNYKKSLSKNKRKAEIARARADAAYTIPAQNTDPEVMATPKENERAEIDIGTSGHVEAEKQHDNVSRSSSSSSSSSSGSSSSDSDSDSSSAFGSDAGHSARSELK